MPALPLHEAGKYVAGAYIVFVALILIYVTIMATRLSRIQRELGELLGIAERRRAHGASTGTAAASGASRSAGGEPARDGDDTTLDEPVGAGPR